MLHSMRVCCVDGDESVYPPETTYKGYTTFATCVAECNALASCEVFEYGRTDSINRCNGPDDCRCYLIDKAQSSCTTTTYHSHYNIWTTVVAPPSSLIELSLLGQHLDPTGLSEIADIAARGSYAYTVSDAAPELHIYDISDAPSSMPAAIGTLTHDMLGAAAAVLLAADPSYLYVAASRERALSVVDVSSPAAPAVIGSVSDASALYQPYAMALSPLDDTVVLVTSWGLNALTTVSVATPSSPAVLGSVSDATLLHKAAGVAAIGGRAFVTAYGSHTVTAVDISNPAAPYIAGHIAALTQLRGCRGIAAMPIMYSAADGGGGGAAMPSASSPKVVVANSNRGSVSIIDVSDVTAMAMIGEYRNYTYIHAESPPPTSLAPHRAAYVRLLTSVCLRTFARSLSLLVCGRQGRRQPAHAEAVGRRRVGQHGICHVLRLRQPAGAQRT